MSDLRDELAEVIYSNMGRSWGWPKYRDALDSPRADLVAKYGKRDAIDAYAYAATAEQAANALLPIITRETTRARAEVGSLIRAHRDAETAYWAMAEDADDETATRLAAEVTRTHEALLASVEGES